LGSVEACYRHPSRETGVSCSNCGRPICPDCMTTTPVGMRCPECARERTKVKTIGAGSEPTLTYVLMGINILLWLGFGLSGSAGSDVYGQAALSRQGLADGQLWQIVTAGFLHARLGESFGILHIFTNMFSLYILGTLLEPAVGRLRFGLIYAVSLLAGSFGALLLQPVGATVGASGAIFGLMGAAVVVMRNRGINPMESGLGLWIGLNLLITFTIPGISIGGHLGGLVGGALSAFVLFDLRERVRVPAVAPNLIAAALGVLAVAGSIAVSASG
jgi:membrane associated rhomboid family serine protease